MPPRVGKQRPESGSEKAPDDDSGPSPARTDGRTERERRVEQVVDLMCRGQWLSGVSDKALAKQWSCTPDNARKVSAEASRVIRSRLRETPEAKEEARAQVLQMFEVIRAKAMTNGDAPSLRVALDALRAYGFYLGIEPAKQLEVMPPKHDPFAGWSTAEKVAMATEGRRPRRALGKVGNEDGGDKGPVH
jgi:hypothetical protein